MLNDNIIEFSYSNEIFTIEISNILNEYKDNYEQEKLSKDDKEIIYKFYDTYRYNKNLHKKIILDFMSLIKYLSNNKESNSAIFEINAKSKSNFSKEFLDLFKDKDYNDKSEKINKNELTVNKTLNIFEYFLKFIFREIKEDLGEYSLDFKDKKIEKKTKDKLEKFFGYKEVEDEDYINNINNKKIINKNNLAIALKWFMTLVLFNEKDKESKIKGNKKNLISYLNVADFWDKNIYNDIKNFNSDLSELKKCNILINKIIWLYDFLIKEEEDPEEEIKEYIAEKYRNINENEEQEEKDNFQWQLSDEEEEEKESYYSSEEEEEDEGD